MLLPTQQNELFPTWCFIVHDAMIAASLYYCWEGGGSRDETVRDKDVNKKSRGGCKKESHVQAWQKCCFFSFLKLSFFHFPFFIMMMLDIKWTWTDSNHIPSFYFDNNHVYIMTISLVMIYMLESLCNSFEITHVIVLYKMWLFRLKSIQPMWKTRVKPSTGDMCITKLAYLR